MLERDADEVERDLNCGVLLPRFAASIYGVVSVHDVHPAGEGSARWHVDREATKAEREQIRAERLAKAVPAEEFLATERARILGRELIEPVADMYRSSMELCRAWREKFTSSGTCLRTSRSSRDRTRQRDGPAHAVRDRPAPARDDREGAGGAPVPPQRVGRLVAERA